VSSNNLFQHLSSYVLKFLSFINFFQLELFFIENVFVQSLQSVPGMKHIIDLLQFVAASVTEISVIMLGTQKIFNV
jgi:hypothetical protein